MAKQMRIRTMLTLGYGVVILLMAIMVVVTHLRVTGIAASIDGIQHDVYPNTTAAPTIRFNVVMNWANTLALGTISNKEVLKRFDDEMASNSKTISENFDFLKREFRTDEGKKLVEEALAARADYTSQRKEYILLMNDEDKDPARFFLMGPLKSSLEAYLTSIGRISSALDARLGRESSGSLTAAQQTRTINLIIGLITPPFAANLFVACKMTKLSIDEILKDLIPFFLVCVPVLLITTFWEPFSLFIPNLLNG